MVSFELSKEIKKDVFWSCHERRTKKKMYEFFIWSCTSTRQVLKVLRKYYRLEVQLAYLVDFAQFLLRFAPHLLSCTPNQSYTSLNHFFNEYVYIDLFLFGLVPLPGRILWGLENITSQKYSLLTQSTSPNCYHGLHQIFLFRTPNCSVTLLGIIFFL